MCGKKVLVSDHVLRRRAGSAIDHGFQTCAGSAQRGGSGLERVVHQKHPRARLPQGVADLGQAPPDVDGIQCGAQPGHRGQVFDIAVGVQ
ncbi:Uncharacterised protein [Mycobacteroides abscessus subsp. abscessus]|nr:Uncharacterised protein [Mycobacteroides abscessus subsp. abscessus]SKT42677.1 Uncharacterised protein [Mycobacteroides abscessus subsp. abscessus]SLC75821.1 Uncharacterised protein [Mycobacteroides abscessus subsp. massiliense]